ncbi:MAG: RsmB/NOP family class I SAM-dependent RNA methyltransferase [Hahellaceae bacterium]|nr:RsmB/NOP family class I SAM-dependent RNA methyltransferase [Hahellaceae bacterium]
MSQTRCWKSYHYPRLLRMWQDWLAQPRWQPADRWLREWQRRNPFIPPPPGKKAKSGTKAHAASINTEHAERVREERLVVSEALFHAMRFLQLAAALEYAYTRSRQAGEEKFDLAEVDWLAWDNVWEPGQISELSAEKFWYWVGLRIEKHCPAPKGLSDADKRKEWLLTHKAAINQQQTPHSWLLWQGLRPQWHSALKQRSELNHWNDKDFVTFVCEQNTFPPLWLRPQGDKGPSETARQLSKEGVKIEWAPAPLEAFNAVGGRGVQETTAYKQGWVEIQDLASQQIAQAVQVQPGEKVWDACAGAGGKSLAIASRMHNKGAIVATDLHANKLDELKRRAKRAGFSNIRSFTWDGSAPLKLPQEIARQKGFDWILIDAPCSASGTWRRNPDARWRFNQKDSAELVELQRMLLSQACQSLREGGQLVYATCSWHADENENQITRFLSANPGFSIVEQRLLGLPQQNSDTMYVAVLKKNTA